MWFKQHGEHNKLRIISQVLLILSPKVWLTMCRHATCRRAMSRRATCWRASNISFISWIHCMVYGIHSLYRRVFYELSLKYHKITLRKQNISLHLRCIFIFIKASRWNSALRFNSVNKNPFWCLRSMKDPQPFN